MAEQTTTDEQTVDTGAETALPADGAQDTAALTANEQEKTNQTQGDAAASLPEVDDKLRSFAKGIGIENVESLSEQEMKLLKIAKDNQAEYQRTAQQASKLEKTISTDAQQVIADAAADGSASTADLALARVAALELSQNVNNFFTANPEAREAEQDMVKIVTERPEIGQLVRSGAFSINDLYALSRGSNPQVVEQAKAQGGQQALQQLANKQTAAAVPGAATTSAVTPPKGDRLMELWSN